MNVIKIHENRSNIERFINLDDVSSIELNWCVIEIYLTARKELRDIIFNSHEEAKRQYEALLNLIPHKTIITFSC